MGGGVAGALVAAVGGADTGAIDRDAGAGTEALGGAGADGKEPLVPFCAMAA
jgi:hypothetical protein